MSATLRHIMRVACAVLSTFTLMTLGGCHDQPDYTNTGNDNFTLLWEIIDRHYCFLEEKNIDWDSIGAVYAGRLKSQMTYDEFFQICSEMLDELKDGHVNLSSNFNTSYYRRWWSDYPQDFNLRTLQEFYLDFDYRQTSGISYKYMPDSIGYIYYPSFSANVGNANLDNILYYFNRSRALIIDIRDNGGGALTNIDTFVSRFITEPIIGGYIRHKTGPGHNDFSQPYPIVYDPGKNGRVKYLDRPIMVLTNRSCYSAANDFVAVMKELPNVRIVGARTGGGGGLPFSSELPIGWSVRFSACPITDASDKSTEQGIDPTPGYECHCTDAELARGVDAILEFALRTLSAETSEKKTEVTKS